MSESPQPGLPKIKGRERDLVLQRRKLAGNPMPDPANDAVGVALSGGGIRSATFCLGLFQGFAGHGVLRFVDYLSTVSGGGYFGSFLGRLFMRRWLSHPDEAGQPEAGGGLRRQRGLAWNRLLGALSPGQPVANVETILKDSNSPPLKWLRESGNYLTPGGSGGSALAAAVFLRNWIAVLSVILVTLLALFLFGNFSRALLDSWAPFHQYELYLQSKVGRHFWWTPFCFAPWLVMAGAVIPLGWGYWLTQAREKQQFYVVTLSHLAVIGFGVFALQLLENSGAFRWVAAGLGAEALLALLWVWGIGLAHCCRKPFRLLLPETNVLLPRLVLCLLLADSWLWSRRFLPASALVWLVLVELVALAVIARINTRWHGPPIAGPAPNVFQPRPSWFSLLLIPLLYVPLPVNPEFFGKLLDVVMVLFFVMALCLPAHDVLEKELSLQRLQPDNHRAALTSWLRNKLSVYMTRALVLFAVLQVLVLVNTWGQTLYAMATWLGPGSFIHAVAGAVGFSALAPLIRSLALRTSKIGGKLRLPLQCAAFLAALALALLLLLSVAMLAHGIAWRWNRPAFAANVASPASLSLWQRIRREWHSPTTGLADVNVRNIPGYLLCARFFNRADVGLDRNGLIQVNQVNPRSPGSEELVVQTVRERMLLLDLGFSLAFCLGLGCLIARTNSFINLSSFHSLYTARLIRAYQAASNEDRLRLDSSIDTLDNYDDLEWHAYRPNDHGGPLHLVNITINNTISLETDMFSTTAKGLNLCVGPAGLSFGPRHALWPRRPDDARKTRDSCALFLEPVQAQAHAPALRYALTHLEPLTLGQWIGISGAAFTTGLGNVGGGGGTAFGTSFLCGLFNIRLGYWWQNRFDAGGCSFWKQTTPTQAYLLDELTGSFAVEHCDRWYLSDGGHFENTAAYELIRRQTPFIIVSDAGADPDGGFNDIANLVLRVRNDFGVEITFFNDDELACFVHPEFLASCCVSRSPDRKAGAVEPRTVAGRIGTLADLHPQISGPDGLRRVRAHATLAWAEYPADAEGVPRSSLLLFIKPGITDDLPADLLNYQLVQPDFPQQSTGDQFFDEAQWESYRKLGEFICTRLFESPASESGSHWYPRLLSKPIQSPLLPASRR